MAHADSSIESALDALFGGLAAVALWSGEEIPDLWPEERVSIQRAVAVRRDEFARGRATARTALSAAGATPGPIGVGPNREPLWPHGYVGSITHCEALVAAVAAPASRLAALGIDAEVKAALPPETRDLVLLPSERATDPVLETVVFSAKESVYKAIFPMRREWLDFLDVEVRLTADGSFSVAPAHSRRVLPPELTQLRGRFVRVSGFVLTGCFLTQSPGTTTGSSPT